MAFWDASALAPLCFHQPPTGRLRRVARAERRMVVWWGTPVELRSTLARLAREGALGTAEDQAQALHRLLVLRRSWNEVLPSERVRALAELLPERYALRAADAFQL